MLSRGTERTTRSPSSSASTLTRFAVVASPRAWAGEHIVATRQPLPPDNRLPWGTIRWFRQALLVGIMALGHSSSFAKIQWAPFSTDNHRACWFPLGVSAFFPHYLCRFPDFNRQERQERQEAPFFQGKFLLFLIIFRLTEQEKVQG